MVPFRLLRLLLPSHFLTAQVEMFAVMLGTWAGAAEVAHDPVFVDDELGFTSVLFFFAGVIFFLLFVVTGAPDPLFGGIDIGEQVGMILPHFG
jgi:hypothetical protein